MELGVLAEVVLVQHRTILHCGRRCTFRGTDLRTCTQVWCCKHRNCNLHRKSNHKQGQSRRHVLRDMFLDILEWALVVVLESAESASEVKEALRHTTLHCRHHCKLQGT